MDKYSLAFSVSNLGPKSFQKLLNKFGSSDRAWNATELAYKELGILGLTFNKFEKFRREFDYVQYTGHLTKSKVEFIGFEDKRYPESLKKIENPPIGLFCKGNLELLRYPGFTGELRNIDSGSEAEMTRTGTLIIGVVGTRKNWLNAICVTKSRKKTRSKGIQFGEFWIEDPENKNPSKC